MFKSVFKICLWSIVLLVGTTQVWSGEDAEDRFYDSDFSSSKNIFIDVKDASLMNVLKIISQQSGLSFIASQDVADKKISVYLNRFPSIKHCKQCWVPMVLLMKCRRIARFFLLKQKKRRQRI